MEKNDKRIYFTSNKYSAEANVLLFLTYNLIISRLIVDVLEKF